MPVRATKRGEERTPLDGAHDVLICGASFAGLVLARELAGSGASVMVIDRYEIGERQTSACGIPTDWLRATGLMGAERQQFDSLLIHTAHGSRRYSLPWSFSTFDYRELCNLIWKGCDARFETAKVNGRADVGTDGGLIAVDTDRGILSAPLVVDALGWRRILAGDDVYQPPDAPLSRGLEVHPGGSGEEMEIWIDRRYVPAGYGWSFPADDEVRVGIGSFDPRFHVRQTTELLAEDLGRDRVRYQGNWIPHKLRAATEGGVFFVGDSAGHCLPLTAEGIRTAFYFAIALGRELRAVLDGTRTREEAAARYAAFNDSHERRFRWMLRVQRLIPRVPPRLLGPIIRLLGSQRFVDWSFDHYLRIAPPEFAEVSAHDQQRAGDQQPDAEDPPRRERDLIEAK
ncbi:MAG TPA: FAD-dependent monooxygenase [Solirubrobacterales bacterium]|nr:FAD-dependent monooxygenase [Solirubrobacterales bacterium]